MTSIGDEFAAHFSNTSEVGVDNTSDLLNLSLEEYENSRDDFGTDLGKSPSEETSKLLADDVASLKDIEIDFSPEFYSKYDAIQKNVDMAMGEMNTRLFRLQIRDAMEALYYDIDSISLLTKSFHDTTASFRTMQCLKLPGDFCNEGLRSSRLQIGFDVKQNTFSRLASFPSFKIAEIPITLEGSVTMQVYVLQLDPQHKLKKKGIRYAPVAFTQLISIICNMTKMFICGNVCTKDLIQEINRLPRGNEAKETEKSMMRETLLLISTKAKALPERGFMKRTFVNNFWFGHQFTGKGLHSFTNEEAICFTGIFDLVSKLLLNGFIECFPNFLKNHQSHLFDPLCRPKEKTGQNTEHELAVQTLSESDDDDSIELDDTIVDEGFVIDLEETLSMKDDPNLTGKIPLPDSYEIHCDLVEKFIMSLCNVLQSMIDDDPTLQLHSELLEKIIMLVNEERDIATIQDAIVETLLDIYVEQVDIRSLLIQTEEELLGMFLSDINDRSNRGQRKDIQQEAQLLTKQALIVLTDLKPESYKVQPREKNQEKQLRNSENRNANPITQQKENAEKYKATRAAYQLQRLREQKRSRENRDNRTKLQQNSTFDYDSRKETKRMQYVQKILDNPKHLSKYAKETLPNLYFHSQKAGCKNVSPNLKLTIHTNPEEMEREYENFLFDMNACLNEIFNDHVLSLDDNYLFLDIAMEGALKKKYASFVASLLKRPNGEYTNELGRQSSKKFWSPIEHHDYMFAMHPYATSKHSNGMKYHLVSGKLQSKYYNWDEKNQWKTQGRLAGINFYNAGSINLFYKDKLEDMSLSELPFLFQTLLAKGNDGSTPSEQVAFDECINSMKKLQMFKSCHSLSNTQSLELRLEKMIDLSDGITSDVLQFDIQNILDTDLILIPRASIFFRNIASIQKCIELVGSTLIQKGHSYSINPNFWNYEKQEKAIILTSIELLATYFPGGKQTLTSYTLLPHLKQLQTVLKPLYLPFHMPLSKDSCEPVFKDINPILFAQSEEEMIANLCKQSTEESPSTCNHGQWCIYFNTLIKDLTGFVPYLYDDSGKGNHALRQYTLYRTVIQQIISRIFDGSDDGWSVWENLFIIMLRMQVFRDSTPGSSNTNMELGGILLKDILESWKCDATVNNIDAFFMYLFGEHEVEGDNKDLSGTGWQTHLPLLLYDITYRHVIGSSSDAHCLIKYHIICACKRYCSKVNSSIFLFHTTKTKRRKKKIMVQTYHIINNDIFNYESLEDFKEETKARERTLNPSKATSTHQLNKDLFFLDNTNISQVLTLATIYNTLIFSEEQWKEFYNGTPAPGQVVRNLFSLFEGNINLRQFEMSTSFRLKKYSQIQSICDSKIIPTFLNRQQIIETMRNMKKNGEHKVEERYNLVKSISFTVPDGKVVFQNGQTYLQFTVEDIIKFANLQKNKRKKQNFIDHLNSCASKNATTPSTQTQEENFHSDNVNCSNKEKVSFVKDSSRSRQTDFNESLMTGTVAHNPKPYPYPQTVTPSLQSHSQANPSKHISPSFNDSSPFEQIESDETFMSPTSDHASHLKLVTPYTSKKNDIQDSLPSSSFSKKTNISAIQNKYLKTMSVSAKLIEESKSIRHHNSISRFSHTKSPLHLMKCIMKSHDANVRDFKKICDDLRELEEDDTLSTLNSHSLQSKDYQKIHSNMLTEIDFPLGKEPSYYTDDFIKARAKYLVEKKGLHLGLTKSDTTTIERYGVQMQWCGHDVFNFGRFHDKEVAYFILLFLKSRNDRQKKPQAKEYKVEMKIEAIKRARQVYGDERVEINQESSVQAIFEYSKIMASKRNEKLVGIVPNKNDPNTFDVRYKFMGKERNFGRVNSETLPVGIFIVKILQLEKKGESELDTKEKEIHFHRKKRLIQDLVWKYFGKRID